MTEALTLLAEADRLAEARCWLEAVDRLQAGNVALRNPAVEERLVELRRDAVVQVHDGTPDPPRPRFPDPYPGRTDLIEFDAADATPSLVGGAVEHHGCVLIRGMLRPDQAATLAADVEQAFDAFARANDGAPPSETSPWYVPLEAHPEYPAFEPESRTDPRWYRVCVIDSPRAMFDLIHAYTEAGIVDIARTMLGTRPLMTGHKWALRRMPRRKLTFWHQEASVFDSGPLRTLNVWMALTAAGGDAPGFEVLPRREQVVHPTVKGFGVSNKTFEEVRDRDYASPCYGPGDAMIFDECLLHRTKSDQSMTGERYSIESWFFSPGGVPDQDQVVL